MAARQGGRLPVSRRAPVPQPDAAPAGYTPMLARATTAPMDARTRVMGVLRA